MPKKYDGAINIGTAKPTQPQLKFTRLYTALENGTDILNQIFEQNRWLAGEKLDIIAVDNIISKRGEYKNLTVTCNLDLHKKLLLKKSIVFGFSESRVYEEIRVNQYYKCFKFAHFISECRGNTTCRRCSSTKYVNKDCYSKHGRCPNCVANNAKGNRLNVRHKATDRRCQCRLERVNGLKLFLIAK